ncbi:MAG: N-acetylmuramic acid 6-phosphate etherase [Flavobacteriales bacterium]|nr:N-acetylmuramic acid 6-phosphate etherase [Flavobacteriales bacterium]
MKITEKESQYNNLSKMSFKQIASSINKEDKKIAIALEKATENISKLSCQVHKKIKNGGRLFYIGSGTSGRLGILDASECPPTFGIKENIVIGIIAGGDKAIRNAVESAEDDIDSGWNDLKNYNVTKKDIVIGISASGSTPYVIGALNSCKESKITTGSITCNNDNPIAKISDFDIKLIMGPEFLTGSTRMKAGTAQKMCLNIITTSVFIKLGHVLDNKMIDMKISNKKLENRAISLILEKTKLNKNKAKEMLKKFKSARIVIERELNK